VNLLTDKPTGSVIDVTLSWPAPPDSQLWRYVDRLLMALWLCGLAWTLVRPAGQLAGGDVTFFLVTRVGFGVLVGGLCAWALLASFRPARPESVRLESGALRHDPGGRTRCWAGPGGAGPIQVARSDVRGFALERVDGQQRLYLELGTGRREVGAALGEVERECCSRSCRGGTRPNHPLQQTGAACSLLGLHRSLVRPRLLSGSTMMPWAGQFVGSSPPGVF
jgi:hypothetical protein